MVVVGLFSVCVVVSDVCVVPVLVRACVLSEVEICKVDLQRPVGPLYFDGVDAHDKT